MAVLRIDPDNAIGGTLRDRLERGDVEAADLNASDRRFGLVLAGFQLVRIIGNWKPDLVHSHTDIPDFVISIARRLRRFRIARTIHSTKLWPTRPLIGRFCERTLREDLVVSISHDAAQAYRDLRHQYGLPESADHLEIFNGIQAPDLEASPVREDFSSLLGADTSKRLFCFVGRISNEKGLDTLIEAIELLPKDSVGRFELHVFGDGIDRPALEARAVSGGLPVRFHGEVPNVSRLLPAFDAALLPSRFEGLSLVALEAMIAGTPVIATSAPGLRDALPANWPFTAEPDNATDFASKMQDFLDGRFDVKAMSRQLIEHAQKKFSHGRMVKEYEKAYIDYLGKG